MIHCWHHFTPSELKHHVALSTYYNMRLIYSAVDTWTSPLPRVHVGPDLARVLRVRDRQVS